ncbi:MAG: S8 family serine peptidase [Casimicrobiaceae bacterium]|nr:S8 family serine peptidase [Casimicrobiaceae bacterium]
MKRGIRARACTGVSAAVLAALLCGTALAQGTPARPPAEPRGGGAITGGVGITIDLGSLFRRLASGLAPQPAVEAEYWPGRVAMLVEVTGGSQDIPTLLPAGLARERARYALDALGLLLIEFETPPGSEEEAIEALERLRPGAIVDRIAALRPQATPGRLYALRALSWPEPLRGLKPQLGIIDAAPTQPLPLDAQLSVERLDGASPGHEHGDAVLCLLACRGDRASGFRGLLPDADLSLVAILEPWPDGRLRGTTVGLARALDRLLTRRVMVANLSLGGPGDRVQRAVVERALARGITLVAAAGNSGPEAAPVYPAAYPGVIAVAAHDAEDRPYERGNRGSYIALAAPGVELWLPIGGGRYVSGTSYAAPFVAARLAWARAAGEPASLDALCARARDLGPPGRDPIFGCGGLRW